MVIRRKSSFMDASISMPCTFPVTCHTDFVGTGSIFVAIEGYADSGLYYIKNAIEKGARTIVVHHSAFIDADLQACIEKYAVILKRVENTRKELALLSAQHAGYPAKQLNIIGITGTKGKTTTSFLLEHILHGAGYKTALISSAQNKICGNTFSSPLTTPQPDYLQQFLLLCVENNVDYVVMEVAAQALTLHRVEGILFSGIIFTNFSHEHLEFYTTLDDYFRAKCLILDMVAKNAPVIINKDNDYVVSLMHRSANVQTYGFGDHVYDYKGLYLSNPITSIQMSLYNQDTVFTCSRLFGEYNCYNVLAAISMGLALRLPHGIISAALSTFAGVPGRLQEHVLPNGARCFIDYAHNPESFQAVLSTLRALTSQLIVIFGAGGGRDKSKRPMMGAIAAEIADIVMVTSDNPRLEDPVAIADDITREIPENVQHKIMRELDREKAIAQAYFLSDHGSIIALLGKGPDEYQIVGKTKHYFSEQSIIEQL